VCVCGTIYIFSLSKHTTDVRDTCEIKEALANENQKYAINRR